jgi:hypothetical protein
VVPAKALAATASLSAPLCQEFDLIAEVLGGLGGAKPQYSTQLFSR